MYHSKKAQCLHGHLKSSRDIYSFSDVLYEKQRHVVLSRGKSRSQAFRKLCSCKCWREISFFFYFQVYTYHSIISLSSLRIMVRTLVFVFVHASSSQTLKGTKATSSRVHGGTGQQLCAELNIGQFLRYFGWSLLLHFAATHERAILIFKIDSIASCKSRIVCRIFISNPLYGRSILMVC